MDSGPNKPSEESGDVDAKDVGDGRPTANDRKAPFIQVFEWGQITLPSEFPHDGLCREGSLLHGNLGHARQRFPALIEGQGEIAYDINIGMPGDCELGAHPDSSPSVGLGLSSIREFLTQWGSGNSTGPKNSSGLQALCPTVRLERQPFLVDLVYQYCGSNLHPQMLE